MCDGYDGDAISSQEWDAAEREDIIANMQDPPPVDDLEDFPDV